MSHDSSHDLSHIYRAGAHEEPPPWLDARIRAAAADACQVPQAEGKRGFFARWQVPVAAAAMVILSTSILWSSRDKSTDPANFPSTAVSGAPMEPPAVAGRSAERRTLPLSPSPAAQTAPDRSVPADRTRVSEVPEVSSAKQTAAREAPAERVDLHAAVTEQAEENQPAAAELAKAESLPAPAATPPVRSSSDAAGANAAHSRELAGRRSARDGVALRERLDPESGLPYEDPAKWLEHIEKLSDSGREREARESLDRFRQAYPAYPVPDKLK